MEKICDKRINPEKGNRIEYRTKWQGWDDKYNTWEPIEHFEGADEHIEAFEHERVEG